jgi:hypothetical protein
MNKNRSLYDSKAMKYAQETFKPASVSDAQALDIAKNSRDNMYLNGNTLTIYGTQGKFTGPDWMQNYPNIVLPILTGKSTTTVENTERYKQAYDMLVRHPEITKIVGHSLGGEVALKLAEQFPERHLTGNVYSSPHIDWFAQDKFKEILDNSRKERQEYYKDKSFIERGANWLQDRELDLIEKVTGLDQKGKTNGIKRHRPVLDPAAISDNSAELYWQSEPFKYDIGPHDYHEIAGEISTSGEPVKTDNHDYFINPNGDNAIIM